MEKETIGYVLTVVMAIAVGVFIGWLSTMIMQLTFVGGNPYITFVSTARSSSKISEECRDFYDTFFSPDFKFEDRFEGRFPDSSGDARYVKLKLFCGALISIEDTAGGEDLERTVNEINAAYGNSYPGLEFQYEEIFANIQGQPKEVWLQEVQNVLEGEISRKVS